MVATPLHIDVRAGAIADLFAILADSRLSTNGNVAIVVGPGIGDEVVSLLGDEVRPDEIHVVRDDTLDEATTLADALRRRSVDVVVGIGGGRTLDVTKYAASRLGLPMVAVATSLAHDGIASPVSVLRVDGGRASYGVAMPIGVIVDLAMVQRSPHALVASGVGDLLSNLSAIADWQLARDVRGERFDGLAATFAKSAAEAVLNRRDDPTGLPFLQCLAESLILSGMAMAVAGTSRPCSGACHEISHAIDELHPGRATHGQQVGVGMLFASYLRGDGTTLAAAARCLAHHGMPTDHLQLGLSDAQLVDAIVRAPTTRADRYTILEHLDLPASRLATLVDAFPTAIADVLVGDDAHLIDRPALVV
jgi:glycerol-1-phosphate dehydrogenase [NAD(P)+]